MLSFQQLNLVPQPIVLSQKAVFTLDMSDTLWPGSHDYSL